MGLLERVSAQHRGTKSDGGFVEPAIWDADRLRYGWMGSSSWSGEREQIENDFEGFVEGILKRNGPVFALLAARLLIFSEARLKFRTLGGVPGKLFGNPDLAILERPWPNATTGDLLARMEQDVSLAGNSYWTVVNGRMRRMRPDRVTIISASREEPELYGAALDAEIVGYVYEPQGQGGRGSRLLLPEQVSHYAPIPDPDSNWRGMSWLTPALREVSADNAATLHKLKFFENGASPQFVVSLDASVTPEQFGEFRQAMDASHKGVDNAYRTLYLGGGADVTTVGKDLHQLDFKATQGAGETRLASMAGVPAVIVGFSEGLSGSSLNQGNFGAARRRFADGTLRPLWRNAAGSLANLVKVPADAELWYDDRDIAFLREDAADQAAILKELMLAIESGMRSGFDPSSVRDAVIAGDLGLMKHMGLISVQLQPPGTGQPDKPVPPKEA
ncbi:MAG: phage portal protein [Streptosporangiaceae bacterium]